MIRLIFKGLIWEGVFERIENLWAGVGQKDVFRRVGTTAFAAEIRLNGSSIHRKHILILHVIERGIKALNQFGGSV